MKASAGKTTRLVDGFGILESPIICDSESCIFSDVQQGGVYLQRRGSEPEVLVPYRKGIGGIARCDDGSLIVTGRNVTRKRPDGTSELLCEADPEAGVSSFNDLAADPSGSIYVGALNLHPPTPTGTPRDASLVLLAPDGTARTVASSLRFPNGIAFTARGERLLLADSFFRCIFSFPIEAGGGLQGRELFAQWSDATPDGMAVAEDGTVWVALSGPSRGRVEVLDRRGKLVRQILFEEPLVTNVALGPADATRLLVTTGSSPDQPQVGRLYEIDVSVAGLPVHKAASEPALGTR